MTDATGSPYTSSVGGKFLFKLAMKRIEDRDQVVASEDFALYAYAALGASQRFPDANKRSSRALYALVWSQIPDDPPPFKVHSGSPDEKLFKLRLPSRAGAL